MSLAHGEGLAGQSAVENDGGEEGGLVHGGEQEAHIAILAAKVVYNVCAVDVVDGSAGGLLDEDIQGVLESTNLQLSYGSSNVQAANAVLVYEGDNVAFLVSHGGVEGVHGVKLEYFAGAVLLGELVLDPVKGGVANVEYYAMDGLEYDAFVMNVLKLNKAVAGGMLIGCGEAFLGLTRSQLALAVAKEWLPSPMAKSRGA